MNGQDPVMQALTAAGAPFEIASDAGRRFFRHAPPNLADLIDTARRHGSATFLVEGDLRLSFDEVFARADALAAIMAAGPGERVAIAMSNSAAWMIGYLAIVRCGATAVLINSRGAGAEMHAAVIDAEIALVLADTPRAAALAAGGYAGRLMLDADFPTGGVCNSDVPPAHPSDPAAILFTSGTTGRSKGAVLSQTNLVTGLMCVQLSGAVVVGHLSQQYGITPERLMANRPQAASLLVFPLFHISGLGSGFLSPLLAGGKIVIMRRWDVQDALALIAQERITTLTAVPTMLWDLLNKAQLGSSDISSLGNVSSGGQGLPLNLLAAVQQALPAAYLGTGFGLTETAGAIAMAMGGDFLRKPASAGRVLALAEVRVHDADGAILPRGSTGEIAVRGPMVMAGYWNRAAETAEVLSADGWFRTGDIGYVDEEDYVFIVDRKKDMVISGGENIYCAEVERVISLLPDVTEVAAFGLPDPRLGERLVAMITGTGMTEAAVQAHVATQLAAYKAPARIVFTTQALPRNAVGKIDKIKLRAAWPHLSGEA